MTDCLIIIVVPHIQSVYVYIYIYIYLASIESSRLALSLSLSLSCLLLIAPVDGCGGVLLCCTANS